MYSPDTQNQPIVVAAVGNTGTGTGSGDVVLETPDGHPNVTLKVITPFIAIVVRFVHLFLKTFAGSFTAEKAMEYFSSASVHHDINYALLAALATAGFGLVTDLITIFKGLEGKYPLATGSI